MIKVFLLFLTLLSGSPILANAWCIDLCGNISTATQWQEYVKKKGALTEAVLAIHRLRETKDFPNSMARLVPEDDPLKRLSLKIDSLKKFNRCELRKILSCLFLQNYDEGLSITAIEISLRLSDNKINEWASKLPETEKQRRLNLIEEISANVAMNPNRRPSKP